MDARHWLRELEVGGAVEVVAFVCNESFGFIKCNILVLFYF